MHRSLSGHLVIAPITPREWGETDASAFCMLQKHLCCRKFIWKQMAAASGFPCKLPWTVISTEYVKNNIIALHLILWQGFNKSIIRTISSLLQSEDPQMACQQTAHSLFTDAYCTQNKKQEPAEIASSDLIGWCYTRLSYLNIWIKIFSLFTMKLISISKTVCLTFYYVCEIICIWMKKKINSKLLHTFLIIASHRSTLLCPCLN